MTKQRMLREAGKNVLAYGTSFLTGVALWVGVQWLIIHYITDLSAQEPMRFIIGGLAILGVIALTGCLGGWLADFIDAPSETKQKVEPPKEAGRWRDNG